MKTIRLENVGKTFSRMFGTVEIDDKLMSLSDKIRNGDMTPEELEYFIVTEYSNYCKDDEVFQEDVEHITWISSTLFGIFSGSLAYATIVVSGKALLALMVAKGVSLFLVQFIAMFFFAACLIMPIGIGYYSGVKFKKWLLPIVEDRLIHEKFRLHMKEIELLKQQQFKY